MDEEFKLSDSEKKFLLKLARDTIANYSATREKPKLPSPKEVPENLKRKNGAFVSLHIHGELRGCIGIFEGRGPLYQTIAEMAISAGWQDPRFPGLGRDETADLEIEISVLSPLKAACAEEVEVGKHGVYITRGSHRGVLLPQVATEYCWDRETFLCQTCLKAGLPSSSWKEPGTAIEVFCAEVFNEKEFG
jgi:uncharacterized protein